MNLTFRRKIFIWLKISKRKLIRRKRLCQYSAEMRNILPVPVCIIMYPFVGKKTHYDNSFQMMTTGWMYFIEFLQMVEICIFYSVVSKSVAQLLINCLSDRLLTFFSFRNLPSCWFTIKHLNFDICDHLLSSLTFPKSHRTVPPLVTVR